jgi:hypothetical protein
METVGGDGPGGDELDEALAVSPLHDARSPVHAGLTTLQVAASALATAERRFAFAALEAAQRYLQETLLPTCRAEEATLFVAIDGLMGVANSCHVMKAQHTTLMRMAGDYAQALDAARTAGDVTEFVQYLGPLLHGLYALARAHLESEDEAYLGLLEAMLSSAQAEALAGAYESSAEQASSDD